MCGASSVGGASSAAASYSKQADELTKLTIQIASSSDAADDGSDAQSPSIDDGVSLDVSG